VRAVCVGAFAKQTALRGYFGELIQAWPFVFNYRCCFSSSCNKKVKFVGTLVFKMLPVQSFAGNSLHRAVDAQKQPLYGRCTLTCTLTQTHMRMHTYTNANTDAHKRTQTYTHTHTHTRAHLQQPGLVAAHRERSKRGVWVGVGYLLVCHSTHRDLHFKGACDERTQALCCHNECVH